MRKGTTEFLEAYFEDVDGKPATGLTLADITFQINYSDNTTPAVGVATYELDNGWYSFSFTDTLAKNFVYDASHDDYQPFPGAKVRIVDTEEKTDTYNHGNSIAEQDVFEEVISGSIFKLRGLVFDLNALTQTTTIRIKIKIDGATYRTIDAMEWDTAMAVGVVMGDFTVGISVKVTMQSSVLEGSVRNIPLRYTMEAV
jgi:GTPase SAR1 family protein